MFHCLDVTFVVCRLFGMVLEKLFIAELQKVSGQTERKICAVGITRLLTEASAMMQGEYQKYWSVAVRLKSSLFLLLHMVTFYEVISPVLSLICGFLSAPEAMPKKWHCSLVIDNQ